MKRITRYITILLIWFALFGIGTMWGITANFQVAYLEMVGNLSTNKTFSNGNNSLLFSFVAANNGPTYDGSFGIEATGAFVGDVFRVHQHTGNPATSNLVYFEAEDIDVTPLRVTGVATKNTTFSGGYVEFNDEVVYDPQTTQVINAVGDAITTESTLVVLNPDADYTLTSTPTIANGVIGQLLYITCANGEGFSVTIQDVGQLAGSNIRCKGDTTTITGQTIISFLFDGVEWIEYGAQDIITIKRQTVINELNIPHGDDPVTDSDTELAYDTNDEALEVYDGADSRLITTIYHAEMLIFAPDGINDQIPLLHVDAERYPHGIKLLNVQMTIPADAVYSMVFEEWAGDPPVAQNNIETVTTTGGDSYKEVRTGNIDDSDIDADDYIFLDIPATDVDWISVAVFFYINDGN